MPIMDQAATMAADVIEKAIQFITGGEDPTTAFAHAQAEVGATDAQLAGADTGDVLSQLCGRPGLPPDLYQYFNAVQNGYNGSGNVVTQGGGNYSGGYGGSYGGGSGSSGGSGGGTYHAPSPAEQIVYNYNTYEQTIHDNDNIFSGNFSGDINVDQSETQVNGDGNVTTHGDGDTNAATGDHSSAAQSTFGDAQANTGDGAVQNTGEIDAPVNTGDNAVQAGDDIDGPVNTGTFTGIQADDSSFDDTVAGDGNHVTNVDGDAVIGDHNQTVQDSDVHDSAIGFGDGDTNRFDDVTDSAVATGSSQAGNVSDNSFGDGAAASGIGDASGHYEDHYTYQDDSQTSTETNTVNADHSVVETEQGPGDAHQDVDQHVNLDVDVHEPHPVRLEEHTFAMHDAPVDDPADHAVDHPMDA